MTVGEMLDILATYDRDQPMSTVLHVGNQVFKRHTIYDVGSGPGKWVYIYGRPETDDENVTGRRAAKRR